MPFAKQLRAGDVVKHTPTGETWMLAYRDGGYVAPCGWPYFEAFARDCELVKAATDDEHRAVLERWAEKFRRGWADRFDRRPGVCVEQLFMLNAGYVGAGI